jgi:glycogen synthase
MHASRILRQSFHRALVLGKLNKGAEFVAREFTVHSEGWQGLPQESSKQVPHHHLDLHARGEYTWGGY